MSVQKQIQASRSCEKSTDTSYNTAGDARTLFFFSHVINACKNFCEPVDALRPGNPKAGEGPYSHLARHGVGVGMDAFVREC